MQRKGSNGKGRGEVISIAELIVVLFLLLILPDSGRALTPEQVFSKARGSVVVLKILNAQGQKIRSGSGVLIAKDRVATNCHVVEKNIGLWVCRGNNCVTADLSEEDGGTDICILDAVGIEGKPAELVKSKSVKVDDPVYALGAPGGRELSFSSGIVKQLRGGYPPFFIQATAAVAPGSSGGGLFDGEGRLLGLTTIRLEGGESLSFAVSALSEGKAKAGRKKPSNGSAYIGWLKRYMELERSRDLKRLLDWCKKWTAGDPESAFAWCALGNAYSRLHRQDEAIGAYGKALSVDPAYIEASIGLGNAYGMLDRFDESIRAYRHALGINPEYAEAWFNLGNAYVRIKRFDESIEAYRRSLHIDPKNAMAWNNLGFSYGSLKRHDEAVEAFQQRLLIKPDAEAWENLVTAYSLSGNREAAQDAFRRLQRLYPDRAEKLLKKIEPK